VRGTTLGESFGLHDARPRIEFIHKQQQSEACKSQ